MPASSTLESPPMDMDMYEPAPTYAGLINLGIFIPGTLAMTLGVIVEHRRVNPDNLKFSLNPDGTYECHYPKSDTMAYSLAAVGLVILGYSVAVLFSGLPFVGKYNWVSLWQKLGIYLCFFFKLVMVGCTIGLFVGSAVSEVRHEGKDGDLLSFPDENTGEPMGLNPMTGGPICRMGKAGLTGGAGILAFCLVVVEMMYYQLMLFAKGFYAHLVVVVNGVKVITAVPETPEEPERTQL
eukprot:TRINITY_DN860_c0_g1_i1.p1 TRINITY_DN860_c0_g1~~TRINITY_DN860_c0_g1_i1.p1  ORF type:complete len:238 (-),score=27.83 TRINITY_DN860_c0_g1_i1:421-1134(-)